MDVGVSSAGRHAAPPPHLVVLAVLAPRPSHRPAHRGHNGGERLEGLFRPSSPSLLLSAAPLWLGCTLGERSTQRTRRGKVWSEGINSEILFLRGAESWGGSGPFPESLLSQWGSRQRVVCETTLHTPSSHFKQASLLRRSANRPFGDPPAIPALRVRSALAVACPIYHRQLTLPTCVAALRTGAQIGVCE